MAIEDGTGRQGMATTLVVVLLGQDRGGPERQATIGHIGDSRIYLFRAGRLRHLTQDHSWVQDEVTAGRLTDSEARADPRRNLLTRALNGVVEPRPDIADVPLVAGDQLLLCSDGLHGVLSDEDIAQILARDVEDDARTLSLQVDPEETIASGAAATNVCDALVRAANARGGPDNITAVVVRI